MYQFNNFCYDKVVKGVLIKGQILLLLRAYYLNSPVVRKGKKNHNTEVTPISSLKVLHPFRKKAAASLSNLRKLGGVE